MPSPSPIASVGPPVATPERASDSTPTATPQPSGVAPTQTPRLTPQTQTPMAVVTIVPVPTPYPKPEGVYTPRAGTGTGDWSTPEAVIYSAKVSNRTLLLDIAERPVAGPCAIEYDDFLQLIVSEGDYQICRWFEAIVSAGSRGNTRVAVMVEVPGSALDRWGVLSDEPRYRLFTCSVLLDSANQGSSAFRCVGEPEP